MKKDLYIKIINNKKYSKNDYLNKYYDLIDEAKYCNVFAVNYKTKKEKYISLIILIKIIMKLL